MAKLGGWMYPSAKTSSVVASTLWCLFFLQYSMKQHKLTVFGTTASSLCSFIFGLVSFLVCLFVCFQQAWETKNDVFEARTILIWSNVMWGPVWTCWLHWGAEGVWAWGLTTLLLGCASKSKLNLLIDQVPSVLFLRCEYHEQLLSFSNTEVTVRLYSEKSATLSSF